MNSLTVQWQDVEMWMFNQETLFVKYEYEVMLL